MKLFLIIVGALVTAFVVCLLIFALWLRRLFRTFTGAISNQLDGLAEQLAHTIPPLRIDLEQVGEIAWQHPEEAAAIIEPLRQARFDSIGSFAMRPSEVSLQAFCRPHDSIYAIIYEHPKAGVWLDFVTRYQDGSRVTYASAADALLDRAENNVVRYHQRMPADELLRRFLAERPNKPTEAMSAEAFVEHFENAYAENMDWMMARGGPSVDEIRRQCEQRGEACNPMLIRIVRSAWAAAGERFYEKQLRERFLADAKLPATRWEEIRNRLVFIHDRLGPDRLEELCGGDFSVEDEDEDDDSSPDGRTALVARIDGAASPRAAFARWNATAPSELQHRKIGELSEPIAADVYVSPMERDDGEDDDE